MIARAIDDRSRRTQRTFIKLNCAAIPTYLEVLDGQRSLYNAELTLAEAQGSEYQSLVQLYKALGGDWK